MKYLLTTLALSILILGYAPGAYSQDANQTGAKPSKARRKTAVDVTYDKKKDTSRVRLEDITLWDNPLVFERVTMSVGFEYPKRTIVKPKVVGIAIIASTKGPGPFLEYVDELSAIVDGSRVVLGKVKEEEVKNRSLTPRGGPFLEMLIFPVSYENFERLAKAKKLTVQVGERTYKLSDKQLQLLIDFLELMQQEGQEFK